MRKYKRTLPLISPIKMAIVTICMVAATMLACLCFNNQPEWVVILSGFVVVLLISTLFVILPCAKFYSFTASQIIIDNLFFRKKITYREFNGIVISKASYNNGYGFGVYGNMPIQYTTKKSNGESIKKTYPFITLVCPDYPLGSIKPKMSSRDVFLIDDQNAICLGICWIDALIELLDYTKKHVYILEEIYTEYKDSFDTLFAQRGTDTNRICVVTENGFVSYKLRNN